MSLVVFFGKSTIVLEVKGLTEPEFYKLKSEASLEETPGDNWDPEKADFILKLLIVFCSSIPN